MNTAAEKARETAIKGYNYLLPEDRIAKFPLEQRDASKLLVYKQGELIDSEFKSITNHLPAESVLVFNNTKVIHARLQFQRATGAKIEVFCLEPFGQEYQQCLLSKEKCQWKVMIGNAKRWKDDVLTLTLANGWTIQATKTAVENVVEFVWHPQTVTFAEILFEAGELPIPPYLNRATEQSDEERYQTVYAAIQGSVAAPTAGLHFTDATFEQLKQNKHEVGYVTLHVGAGTFLPVKSETLADHTMHRETVVLTKTFIEQLFQNKNKAIIPVGTTSMRSIESLYWVGHYLYHHAEAALQNYSLNQWYPYENEPLDKQEVLSAVLERMEAEDAQELHFTTQLLIAPGYIPQLAKGLITNFHQPESTLLVLISALLGDDWRKVYGYALANDYRFLSYGDSSLLLW